MKKTVFISSTFLDLKEERRKVWETLEKFDVIVKGMEEFGARREDALTTCLKEVEQSDIFVGIIGFRFGSIDKKTNKSFTQLEYEKAYELSKEVLIYLIDDQSMVRRDFIQDDKVYELDSFKKILNSRHTTDRFSNSDDLIDKLKRQFSKYLTAKKNSDEGIDEYVKSREFLAHFFLVPKALSGREVKLKIKLLGNPKPASQQLCKLFNFDFGKTIVSNIQIASPQIDMKDFNPLILIVGYEYYSRFMGLDKNEEHDVYATILFHDEKPESVSTDFVDKTIKEVNENFYALEDIFDNSGDLYINKLKPGEGQVLLQLKEML